MEMDEKLSNWGDRRDPLSVGLANVPKVSQPEISVQVEK